MKRYLPILLLALIACGTGGPLAAALLPVATPTEDLSGGGLNVLPHNKAIAGRHLTGLSGDSSILYRSSNPTPPPTSTPTPSPTPAVVGYLAYRVQPGDSLASVAAAGGSDAELLLRYNHLEATPQVGHELIIPQLEGREPTLPTRGMLVLHGNTRRPWVALTLDCGNSAGHLGTILDELRAESVHLTFFLHGSLIESSPVELRRLVDEGHEIANHSYSHPDFTTLSDSEILDELDQTEAAIQGILGPQASTRPYFRFPYGAHDKHALQVVIDHGYLPIHWTLDTQDSLGQPKTPEFIVERIMALPPEQLRGAILLGHCTNAITGAIPQLIPRLREAGYELHTLSEVLGE